MSAGIISYDGEITSPKLLGGWGRSRTPPCMMRHFVTSAIYADPMADVGMTIMWTDCCTYYFNDNHFNWTSAIVEKLKRVLEEDAVASGSHKIIPTCYIMFLSFRRVDKSKSPSHCSKRARPLRIIIHSLPFSSSLAKQTIKMVNKYGIGRIRATDNAEYITGQPHTSIMSKVAHDWNFIKALQEYMI
ncbi:hypothetical protein SO802_033495 [Lithocarpus litseifolius]|uniref:Uncharacterized protein n=1 Tax=Lithocarpus litseifolius TaxID=425828 RepID=A0AAW2BIN2_9ROSI